MSTMPWDRYAAQSQQMPWEKYAAPAQTPDLSNAQGQGTYNMWDTAGQMHPVPYSQVPMAAHSGYRFDINPTKTGLTPSQQFQKDFNYATTGPGNEAAFAQSDKNAPLPMQVVSGVVKGLGTIGKPVMDVVGAAGGVPQSAINASMEAQTPAEGVGKYATIGAAAAPSLIAAPIATAGAAVGGTIGVGAGHVIGKLANLSPTQTELLKDTLGIAGSIGGGMGASSGGNALRSYLRPTPSPSIVPRTEMAARQLSAAILPATKDAPNFIQAAQQEVPNILEYAQRTNNPLNTQLEFSKAAQGYAQEVRDLYETKILGPVESKIVKTTGTGFGERMNEGQDTYATLGEIDKRIVDLNKQLDAPALNSDDARRALASRIGLQNEASFLKNILHRNLGESTGLSPEQVADVRQRVGRSYELAHDTEAAVTARMQAAGKTDMGPIHISQIPSNALEYTRGGPVPIADRAFQRAIAQFPGQPQPLPTVTPQVTMRPAVSDTEASAQRLNNLIALIRDKQNAARSQ